MHATMDFNLYTFLKKLIILLCVTQRLCESYILNNVDHPLNHHTHHRGHHTKNHHINSKSFIAAKSNNGLNIEINRPKTPESNYEFYANAINDGDNNPCLTHYCPKGKECELNAATNHPTCVCQRSCDRPSNPDSGTDDNVNDKPICGSDGMVYENHCELHRAACILNRPIAFQRLEKCTTEIEAPAQPMPINHSRSHDGNEAGSNAGQSLDATAVAGNENNRRTENDVERNVIRSESTDNERLSNKCTSQEYEIMKDNLLLFNHARLMTRDNNHSKDFLVSIMFSHYDQNNNGHLDAEELNEVSQNEQLDELSNGCILRDMLNYDDLDKDQCLSINEFYQAFNKLYSEWWTATVAFEHFYFISNIFARCLRCFIG